MSLRTVCKRCSYNFEVKPIGILMLPNGVRCEACGEPMTAGEATKVHEATFEKIKAQPFDVQRKLVNIVDRLFLIAAQTGVKEFEEDVAYLGLSIKELRWRRFRDIQPTVPGQYEIAIPRQHNLPQDKTFTWLREYATFGRGVADEPLDGWCNHDWHRDVSSSTAVKEDWYWRPVTANPVIPPT